MCMHMNMTHVHVLKRRETAGFSSARGLNKSMQESIVQAHSMVTPCPDRSHTRCELFLIGFLEALPVCPMAPLVFIDFLSGPPGALRSASCRFRRGSARQMGSRPVYWTSSNLQGCIVSRRRVSRTPFTSDSGCQSHFDGKPRRLPKACQMASSTQTKTSLLFLVYIQAFGGFIHYSNWFYVLLCMKFQFYHCISALLPFTLFFSLL